MILSHSVNAQVSGAIFRDFNGNGTKDLFDPLIPGITVSAYNTSGVLCGSVVSSTSTGSTNYTLTGCGTGKVRIEFTLPASGTIMSANSVVDVSALGADSYGSSVQFVNGNSTNVNFAIFNPNDYGSTTFIPKVYVPCYTQGDPLASGAEGTSGGVDWFVGYPYGYSGDQTTHPTNTAKGGVIGAAWGVAYSKQAKKIFTSALVKRHVGLGQLGTGGIYMVTETPGVQWLSIQPFYDLDANGYRTRAATPTSVTYGQGSSYSFVQSGSPQTSVVYLGPTDPLTGQPEGLGVIGTNPQRGLTSSQVTPNYDPAAFDQVGKVGLGDLEISDDGQYLFVVNLYTRKLMRLQLNSITNPTGIVAVTEYSLPAGITAPNGVLRPWALKFHRGKLYIGAVSTAENGGALADVSAYVFEINAPTGALTFTNTPVLTYPFTFQRGGASGTACQFWNPWTNNTANLVSSGPIVCYPQPILSDLEFTDRGDLLLSFLDRGGNQWGLSNYSDLGNSTKLVAYALAGDIQIAGLNSATNAFTLENKGSIRSINNELLTGEPTNSQGPGGGEFFYQDLFIAHNETTMGAMALLKGDGRVLLTMMDTYGYATGGTGKFSTSSGTDYNNQRYTLYGGGLGKAIGLGDLELANPVAPIEIGNRVWFDTNQDGIQDAGEPPIAGAVVRLYDATKTTLLASAVTNATGQYYFTSRTDGVSSTSYVSATVLQPNTSYALVVAGLGSTGLSVTAVSPATPGETGAVNSGTTTINNDATLDNVGGQRLPCIKLTTGDAGSVQHTFDFGFTCVMPAVAVSPSQVICQGGSFTLPLSATVTSGTATGYQWYFTDAAGSFFSPISGATSLTFSPTPDIQPSSAGGTLYYAFTAFNGGAVCAATAIRSLTVKRTPTIDFTAPASAITTVCANTTMNLSVSTTAKAPDAIRFVYFTRPLASPTDAYTATGGTVLGTVNSGTAATNTVTLNNAQLPDLVGSMTQTLYVYALLQSADGVCKPATQITIVLTPRPTVSISGNTVFCQGTADILTASGPAGTTYQWYLNSGTAVVSTTNPFTTPVINANTTYRVRGTLSGCVSDDATYDLTPVVCTSCTAGPTSVGGVVFRDFGSDGIDGTTDPGMPGITVTIFRCDANGQSTEVATMQTDLNGAYSFTGLTAGTTYRVEFTNLPDGYSPTYRGTNNGTTVQFTQPGNCTTSVGINHPDDYCQTNPTVVTPCYISGAISLGAGNVLVSWPYNNGAEKPLATKNQIGSTWGLAYAKKSRQLFSSAFVKRYVGIPDLNNDLKADVGNIYVTSNLSGTPTTVLWKDLTTLGLNFGTVTNDGARGLSDPTTPVSDPKSLSLVFKAGIGDIDISSDEKTLYVVNLYNRPITSD